MRRVFLTVFSLLAALVSWAQTADYYRPVQGLRQAELKTALHNLIQPATVPQYGGKGEGYTWWAFTRTDAMPDGSVRDRYSHNRYAFNGLNAVAGMNIEHSFANSWWGHAVNNAYCDIFNLFPSDAEANGRKSNNPIGVVDGAVAYDNGVTRVGRSTSYRADSLITVWEPADEWKGDFARTYFYMATCYEDYADLWQTTEGLLMVQPDRYPTLRPWVARLLLRWNEQDPVDDIERTRNDAVQSIQMNRNPFVDYPQLADYIWGDSVAWRFYTTDASAPELFVPAHNATLRFGLQPLSRGFGGEVVVRGRAATDDVRLAVDNDNFTLGTSLVAPDQLTDGISIPFACRPTEAGRQTARLTIAGGGIETECYLEVDFCEGIPAYEATDIVCSVNSKRFTASWMRWAEGETYTLNVWTDGGKPVDGYPMTTADTAAVVSGLKASTRYCYDVTTAGGVKSPVVTVDMPEVTPVFSSSAADMAFTAVPGAPSRAQTLTVTAIEVKRYETQVEVSAPFEVSADGETWTQRTTLRGASQTLHVRLGAVAAEGVFEGELLLTTEGAREIVVTLSGEVDAAKAFFENFENGSKNAYAEATVSASASTWRMANALIGSDANGRKNDARAVRIRVQKDNPNEVAMDEDFAQGCDSLWFWAGPYNKDTGMRLSIYASTDQGVTWTPVDEELVLPNASWTRYGYALGIDRPLRLRFVGSGSNGKRINIDDIQMSAPQAADDGVRRAPSPHDIVSVYTASGILVRTGRRASVTANLPSGLYIVK